MSIHSSDSRRFLDAVVQPDDWYKQVAEHGYRPALTAEPGPYRERNNASARRDMLLVRNKVEEWIQQGSVVRLERPALCTNPLSVVTKLETSTGTIKKRVCIDLSRSLNTIVQRWEVNMDDLSATEHLRAEGDHMMTFDLANMFFHVQLSQEAQEWFGFSVPDVDGTDRFYKFTVMAFGYSPAVAVVTRLLKPLLSYIHDGGIKLAVFVDDGQLLASSAQETEDQMRHVLTVFQLAGWNIQWAKTSTSASQQCRYLGVNVDLENMSYTAPEDKINQIIQEVKALEEEQVSQGRVPVHQLATTLGRIGAIRMSHGTIMHTMTRRLQHSLGCHTRQHGWEGHLYIDQLGLDELGWVNRFIRTFNGRPIRDETAPARTCDSGQVRRESWGSDTHTGSSTSRSVVLAEPEETSYIRNRQGEYEAVQEVVPTQQAGVYSGAVQELQLILQMLMQLRREGQYSVGRIWWKTELRNCYKFLKQGSRHNPVRQILCEIAEVEKDLGAAVVPVWESHNTSIRAVADHISRFSSSTDEWGVQQHHLEEIFTAWGIWPTVDAFASSELHICKVFFAKTPQCGAQATNFFAQQLQDDQVYFCCPPVSMAGHTLNKLEGTTKVTAVVVVPAWPSASYWPLLRDHEGFRTEFRVWSISSPSFRTKSGVSSLFTSGKNIRIFTGLWITGS